VVSTLVRREQALFAHGRGVSLERACSLVRVARSSVRYQSRMIVKDAPVIAAMRELSARYPRFGYRRIRIYLEREGHFMGMERAHRLWRQAGLQVPRKRARRKVATARPRPNAPTGPNQVWAYDFVFDRCANDQTLKCLTIVDEWLHECLAIGVRSGIRSARVIEVLSRLISERGAPRYLRSDNGPEFVSHAVLHWLQEMKIETALNDPGSPWQNGTNESFNGKFRDECLNMEWFRNRAEARVVIEQWRIHYNEDRPHSTLGYLTPMQFKQLSQYEGDSK
jgi:putative transposase